MIFVAINISMRHRHKHPNVGITPQQPPNHITIKREDNPKRYWIFGVVIVTPSLMSVVESNARDSLTHDGGFVG